MRLESVAPSSTSWPGVMKARILTWVMRDATGLANCGPQLFRRAPLPGGSVRPATMSREKPGCAESGRQRKSPGVERSGSRARTCRARARSVQSPADPRREIVRAARPDREGARAARAAPRARRKSLDGQHRTEAMLELDHPSAFHRRAATVDHHIVVAIIDVNRELQHVTGQDRAQEPGLGRPVPPPAARESRLCSLPPTPPVVRPPRPRGTTGRPDLLRDPEEPRASVPSMNSADAVDE